MALIDGNTVIWAADNFHTSPASVPIPATAALLGMGLFGLIGARRLRRKTPV